jgi:hypothetical protein
MSRELKASNATMAVADNPFVIPSRFWVRRRLEYNWFWFSDL